MLAHRGYHAGGAPENSMRAFREAVALGVDSLELDVHRTRDGVLVVHHDAELADGRAIADLDYAQLPALAGGEPIPTLAQVTDLASATGMHLQVELKGSGYERQAVAELLARAPRDRFDVISFHRGSIRTIEQFDPSVRTGLLEPRLPAALRNSPLYTAALWVMDRLDWHPSLGAASRVGADYVTVEHRMATEEFIAAARERGIPVHAWTVDDPVRMRALLDAGVAGLVTDRPDLALQVRDQAHAGAAQLAAA